MGQICGTKVWGNLGRVTSKGDNIRCGTQCGSIQMITAEYGQMEKAQNSMSIFLRRRN